jgi:catechol 2,3-dioxygenase-like lactoylglutathione lyase family enzyme
MSDLPRHAFLAAALLSGFAGAVPPLQAQDGRTLDGIAHVALRVSDVPKLRAFYKTLGWEQAFEFSDDKGTTTSYVKVSDRQFIELYRKDKPSDALGLMHICMQASDLDRVAAAYAALGLAPTQPRKARAGNVLFNLRDPEGQIIECTQYLPGSLHYSDHGKHLGDARISDHMIGVVLTARDVEAERAFFTGKLGFSGSAYKLGVPGNPGETIELKPRTTSSAPELRFAADPKRAVDELKKRGLEVTLKGGVPEVRDPDGTIVSFDENP